MPYPCCVPFCKGNYPSGPKVSTFSFPRDQESREKWIQAIKRGNFTPTKSSKVCELHFQPHQIERVTSFYVETTGELLTASLKNPRLSKGALPTKLVSCPEVEVLTEWVQKKEIKKEKVKLKKK